MTDPLDRMRPDAWVCQEHGIQHETAETYPPACLTCGGLLVRPIPTTRVIPCPRTTWCTLADGHTGDCHEVPRRDLPPSDFGPERAKRRRW